MIERSKKEGERKRGGYRVLRNLIDKDSILREYDQVS